MLLIEAARCLGFGVRVVTGLSLQSLRPRRRYGRDARWGEPMHGPIFTFRVPAGVARLDRMALVACTI